NAHFPPRRQGEESEAQIDRHASLSLFFEAVGLDAGQRLDQRRLAVINVTRRPDDMHETFHLKQAAGRDRPAPGRAPRPRCDRLLGRRYENPTGARLLRRGRRRAGFAAAAPRRAWPPSPQAVSSAPRWEASRPEAIRPRSPSGFRQRRGKPERRAPRFRRPPATAPRSSGAPLPPA